MDWDIVQLCWCRRGLGKAKEWIQFGKHIPEKLSSYLQIGTSVEVTEDGRSYMVGTIEDVRIGTDKVVFKPRSESDRFHGNNILVDRVKVRPEPESNSSIYVLRANQGVNRRFMTYNTVDIWIQENGWLVLLSMRLFKDDLTMSVRRKMRFHQEWDSVTGSWNSGVSELELERLRSSHQLVGLAGNKRARILQFGYDHVLVEYTDVKNPYGTCVKEVINIKMWHKSLWRRGWKEMISWLAPKDDPAQEFECYMPGHVYLAVLGVVSSILSTDPAQNWPDSMVPLFYSLEGISALFCTVLLMGILVWQPKTRAQLLK